MIANVDQLMRMPLDDLVFEHRNKLYGAYVLRKLYSRHLFTAMLLAVSVFLLFLSLPVIFQKLSPPEIVTEVPSKPTEFIEIVLPPPPIREDQPAASVATPSVKTKRITPPVIVTDPGKDTPGDFTKGDDPATDHPLDFTGPGTTTDSGKGKVPITDPPVDIIYEAVEIAPVFPGGDRELMSFVQRHIRVPKVDVENSASGKIFVGFVVDKDGSITNIEIKKGISPTLDAEAVRLVKLFPRFIPGQMNGKPVKVRFVLPLKITLQ
jgi:protein TonB